MLRASSSGRRSLEMRRARAALLISMIANGHCATPLGGCDMANQTPIVSRVRSSQIAELPRLAGLGGYAQTCRQLNSWAATSSSRDEAKLRPSHSITSSALAISVDGRVLGDLELRPVRSESVGKWEFRSIASNGIGLVHGLSPSLCLEPATPPP